MAQGLTRSRDHRLVAGVAGGMAERFGVPVWLARLVWLFLFLPGGAPGLILYLVFWVIMPLEPRNP